VGISAAPLFQDHGDVIDRFLRPRQGARLADVVARAVSPVALPLP
jgi:hypothetical protein